ncbi:MAG: hypothetical protein DRP42_01545 [Tenericutes bacterium]|nr:MAG: hypothetical protein DRP42_01545 [Mycoplasmatota bacterium]
MEEGVGNSIKVIFLAAPAVLFSFAGIVLPASLQGETKSPSTFKKAFISGTLFIVAIYLLFSIAIFATFDGQEGSLTLAAAINNLFSAQTAA